MKIDYTKYLKDVYPSSSQFRRLLPPGEKRTRYYEEVHCTIPGMVNMTKYGLFCEGFLGYGGYSLCYKASDHLLFGKKYACKVAFLDSQSLNGADPVTVAEKTLEEIRMMKALYEMGTPGVMPLLHFTPEQEIEHMIHELKSNPKKAEEKHYKILQLTPLSVPYTAFLEQLHKKHPKLSTKQAAALILDMAEALYWLQNRNFIHRDFKPQNLFLAWENYKIRVVISDFNISKDLSGKSSRSPDITITAAGTEKFRHPALKEERLHLSLKNAQRTDVYSLGVVAYLLLNAGQMPSRKYNPPYPRNSPSDALSRLVCSMMDGDLKKIPTVEQVIRTLYRFL